MSYKHYIFSIFLFCATLVVFAQKNRDANFLFPLDIPPSVSGSFAELRSNHFHSGIDLSTQGKLGIPIKSMEVGTISRIKVSAVGYGNAVYIKHPNGYTTVYGHLRNYSIKIDSIITAEQYKIESFGIDFFPTSEIHIKRGEIIGYTGNSGSSGGPHLHYEIRETVSEEPVNPFFYQNKIKDDVRPKLLTLRVYPVDENSAINGSPIPKNYTIVFYDGQYHLKGNPKIYASGKVGVAIEMLDYMTGSWKKCGVYKLNMKVNGHDYYSWELDQFSFSESRYINSHIDYGYRAKYGKRFERCFRQPGNKMRIYGELTNDGIIHMDSSKIIFIKAADAANNLSQLNFTLLKGNDYKSSASQKVKLAYNQHHHLKADGATCDIPNGALYENAAITFEKKNTNVASYQIGAKEIPLHKCIRLSVKIPDSLRLYKDKLCLASVNGSGKHYYAGGNIKEDSLILTTRSFGNYTFKTDTIAPTIRALQNIKGRVFNTNSKFLFKISDNFSGIKSYDVYLNDSWVLCEYDAKSNKLTCPLSKAKVKKGGNYNFKLVIKDNCGNEKTLSSHFMVR
ncbi:M23 family metallopeptidase [Labilibacter marinus]|uniref:M23 family metallopeptidase n=1 Tax=Labilibacter marinus TaxID=1477105 RepID=UPI00094F87C5|nr:M23 family metallopeptidase [Labilibacter marinus]